MKKFLYFLLFSLCFSSCRKYVKLNPDDFEIVKQTDDYLIIEMKIINNAIYKKIQFEKNNTIALKLNNILYVAKGNEITKSSVPDDCDYFFPVDNEGNTIFFDDKLFLYKISEE